jgi:arylformamidase
MPAWPGDTEFTSTETWSIDENCPVRVSKFTQSTHAGTHADAPSHYDLSGRSIDTIDLKPYLGICQVIDLSNTSGPIEPHQLVPPLKAVENGGVAQRILIKTYKKFPHDRWDSDFRPIAPKTIDRLADLGCILIGTDTPSLDPETSKSMDAHMAVKKHSMAILEGLVFDDVEAGFYELIALPLKITGGDAAPVRAVLREL